MIVKLLTALELGYGVNAWMERRRLEGRYLVDVVFWGPNLAQACNVFVFGVNISIVVGIGKSLLIVKSALNPKIQYKIQSKGIQVFQGPQLQSWGVPTWGGH
jgi:hypothetical protein